MPEMSKKSSTGIDISFAKFALVWLSGAWWPLIRVFSSR
jgi:hypothetical protein